MAKDVVSRSNRSEEALLGCILLDNSVLDTECSDLLCTDFYNTKYGRMYKIFQTMHRQNIPIRLDSAAAYILEHKEEHDFFGHEITGIITHLSSSAESSKTANYHAKLIVSESIRRKATQIVSEGLQEITDNDDIVTSAGNIIMRLSKIMESKGRREICNSEEMATEFLDVIQKEMTGEVNGGCRTGFADLDKMFRMREGNLIVLAARPSMGKTALALNIAVNNAWKDKKKILIASLEMSRNELEKRLTSRLAPLELEKLMSPDKLESEEDKDKLFEGIERLSQSNIFVVDKGVTNVASLSAVARVAKARSDIDILIIDHLQLMDDSDLENRNTSAVRMIAHITRELKLLAMELGIPIILLSQLSRAVEARQEKEPQLSDLRDSGTIEQDADVVLMMYRPAYYAKEDDVVARNDPRAIVSVAKNRNGRTGRATLFFKKELASFTSYTTQEE